jgi:hypothetical protein
MGKASRTKQAPDRRARIAAQQAAARRAEQRKRLYLAGGSILAVIIVVVAFVLIKQNNKGSHPPFASNGPTGAALTSVTKDVTTGVSQSVLDKVGAGAIAKSDFIPASGIASAQGDYFATANGSPLASGGKPEVLYIGAEYCPFCAVQRWSMIASLSRFGTFSGLKTIHSSSTDAYPNTPTWSFYGSTYTSKYINFTPVETTTNERQGNSANTSVGYVTLQNPTSAQATVWRQYDSSGSIPFIDIGGKYIQVGNMPPASPQDLAGKTWAQVATQMAQPSSTIARDEGGAANYMTAGICELTNNQPSTACTPAIQALEKNLAPA